MPVNSYVFSWDAATKTFCIEMSTLECYTGHGRGIVPRTVSIQSARTNDVRTFAYERAEITDDYDREVVAWHYTCDDMKLVVFND